MNRNRIQIEEFLTAYMKAHSEGLTRDEFAKRIGIKANSVYQRVYELNRNLKAIGKPQYPLLRTGPRQKVVERAAALLQKVGVIGPSVRDVGPVVDESNPLADILG